MAILRHVDPRTAKRNLDFANRRYKKARANKKSTVYRFMRWIEESPIPKEVPAPYGMKMTMYEYYEVRKRHILWKSKYLFDMLGVCRIRGYVDF